MKTTVRITLAKLAKVKGHYTKITDDSTRKGLRVPCVVRMRSLIGQQSNCLGDWEPLREINRAGQFVTVQKSEEKHCFSLVPRLNGTEQPATKGGEID